MKNSLSKIVLATMIATAPLVAGEYSFNSSSLFAIEGGMTNVNTESGVGDYDEEELASVGLKVGGQTDNYRVFLAGRYYDVDNLSHLVTYGVEVQYLFNFSEPVNFFIGGNAGQANLKVARPGVPSESVSEMYYGGDAGFNIHASELIDIEIGARYMSLDLVTSGVKVDKMVAGYASVIIKWDMN